jgi:hypothetical protein
MTLVDSRKGRPQIEMRRIFRVHLLGGTAVTALPPRSSGSRRDGRRDYLIAFSDGIKLAAAELCETRA